MKAVKSHNSAFTHRDIRPSVSRSLSRESGDVYIKNLFCSLFKVNKGYWEGHKELKNELDEAIRRYEQARNMIEAHISDYRTSDL